LFDTRKILKVCYVLHIISESIETNRKKYVSSPNRILIVWDLKKKLGDFRGWGN
jgi:hypothetical protein